MSDDAMPSEDLEETRARRVWVGVVLALLGSVLVIQGVLVVYAHNDPSAAVEPDYYAKGLAWDATQAQLRKNVELGWRVEVDARAAGAQRLLVVRPTDGWGVPLEDARVTVIAFHKARAAARTSAELTAKGDGTYEGLLPLVRPGHWEVRLVVDARGERFANTQVIQLPELGGAK